ncbi:MAG: Mce-associated rane protein [Mycobacterium sp.]|nr:Mce-associated rane protein [Mycobacterium sp.]
MTTDDTTDVADVDKAAGDETGGATEVTESAAEATEAENEDKEAPSDPRDSVVRQTLRGARARIGVILLAAALVASAGVASWLFFFQYRPDQEIDAAAAKVAIDAASKGSVALLTYSPGSLDKDFAAAKSHLTGDFLSYYTQFTEQIVTPAAKQKAVKTTATVVRSAVGELHPDSAVVLVFINQNTTSKENPDGAFASSTVKVGMKKIDGTWRISSFDPV